MKTIKTVYCVVVDHTEVVGFETILTTSESYEAASKIANTLRTRGSGRVVRLPRLGRDEGVGIYMAEKSDGETKLTRALSG